jgi:hypothetical protein
VEEVVESILQSARKVLGAPKWMSRV